jgi:predicted NAD-dependent protein-ADP-ribosyltransferase YbiA (DUF1768 family)
MPHEHRRIIRSAGLVFFVLTSVTMGQCFSVSTHLPLKVEGKHPFADARKYFFQLSAFSD